MLENRSFDTCSATCRSRAAEVTSMAYGRSSPTSTTGAPADVATLVSARRRATCFHHRRGLSAGFGKHLQCAACGDSVGHGRPRCSLGRAPGDERDARRPASMDPLSRGRGTADAGESRGAEVPCLSGRDGARDVADRLAIAMRRRSSSGRATARCCWSSFLSGNSMHEPSYRFSSERQPCERGAGRFYVSSGSPATRACASRRRLDRVLRRCGPGARDRRLVSRVLPRVLRW
jgi:hypothetical protein